MSQVLLLTTLCIKPQQVVILFLLFLLLTSYSHPQSLFLQNPHNHHHHHIQTLPLKSFSNKITSTTILTIAVTHKHPLLYLHPPPLASPQTLCKLGAILLHYWLLASFGWMLCEGVHMYRMLYRVFPVPVFRVYSAIAYGEFFFEIYCSILNNIYSSFHYFNYFLIIKFSIFILIIIFILILI